MLVYGATMFLSAFLLFLVQPMIGKFVLPWFGGAPAVWTTCMLFFQAILLAGYAYAHGLATRATLRTQARLHVALLVVSSIVVLWLSVAPSPAWKPLADQSPVERILGLLLVTIGAPFFLLSATAPLLQSWFSRTRPERFPYRLYAVSNLGSLLAILSYPFVIEPSISLSRQASLWSWTYAVFAIACGLVAWQVMSAHAIEPVADQPDGELVPQTAEPGIATKFVWLALAACSSVVLLATTSMMSQDLAVVPLLWILPLSLYLLSFVICFQHERLYWRPLFLVGLVASVAWITYVLGGSVFVPLRTQIAAYSTALFMVCMVCHGELVRLRPASRHLTSFYLMVAGGGALGGFLVTVVATAFLRGFWEYHFGLLAATLLVIWVLFRERPREGGRPVHVLALCGVLVVLWGVLAYFLTQNIRESTERNVEMARNFFGVLRLQELFTDDPSNHQYSLVHGRIEHGYQFQDPEKRHWPVSYYGPTSGMGAAILLHPARARGPMRIAVIGLGAGIAATYGRPGDVVRFYEINPEVVRLSEKYFTYRKETRATTDVTLGDARVSLERRRDEGISEQFDVIVIDAFSSDAIPVHLLTRECFDTFRFHLKPDGILAFHVTSRFFDLKPVLRSLSVPGRGQMHAAWFYDPGNPSIATDRTDWVLLTANEAFLATPEVRSRITPWPASGRPPVTWTDDYSNLVSVIQERGRN